MTQILENAKVFADNADADNDRAMTITQHFPQ